LWQARRFPLVVLPSSLVDALAAALPLPLIAWLFGPAAAGQFALVWRVAALPGGLVAASVGDVFHAHAARARDEGPDPSRRLLLDTMRMLGLLAILIYLPLCIVSPWVFGWIFGEPWREAGEMLRLLGPLWVTAMVVSPVSRLPVVLGRPGLKFVFDLCFLVLPMVALVVASSRGLMTALLAYGLATAAAYAVFAVLLYAVAGRRAVQSPPPRTDQDP
jgi:O-antigen/teichoic acid export membrane protein